MRSADRRAAPPARPRRFRAAGGGGVAHAFQEMHGVWWSAAERLGVVWLVVAGSRSKPATRLTCTCTIHVLTPVAGAQVGAAGDS